MTFAELALSEPLQRALADKNYTEPSPIQEQTIPYVLAGRDVLGCAQTGTGKTAAFALPILEHMLKNPKQRIRNAPRVLVLAPTRELASQIKTSFDDYGAHLKFLSAVVFGGVSQFHQERAMQRGPEVLVATPGRLLDLLGQNHVILKHLEVLVLDEADRMLDMGFIHDVKRIMAMVPKQRQTLFFSATMPSAIQQLSSSILTDPYHVMVTPESTTVEKIDQKVFHVAASQKRDLLLKLVQEQHEGLTLVFTGTKHGANRIAEGLTRAGVKADAIHGNKSQGARERALENFRSGRARVLVATDIAARGIDVKGISLVVNYDLPKEPEAYVHRIGRTARAGAGGKAISLCGEQDGSLLRQIERTIRMTIPVESGHAFHREPAAGYQNMAPASSRGNQQRQPQQRQAPRRNSGPGGPGSHPGQFRKQGSGAGFNLDRRSPESVPAGGGERREDSSTPAAARVTLRGRRHRSSSFGG